MTLKFRAVNELPAQLEPHTLYFVKKNNNVTTYITDSNSSACIQSNGDSSDVVEPLMFAGGINE